MRYLLIMLFFASCNGMIMHKSTSPDEKDHINNLFRGARNNFPTLITNALDAGINPDVTRITTPALEARLHGHHEIAALLEKCKSRSNIEPTGTQSDWTLEKLNALYEDRSLFLSQLPIDKIARNAITVFLFSETFSGYDEVEEKIESLENTFNKVNEEYTLRRNQLHGYLNNGEEILHHQKSFFKKQIREIDTQIACNIALFNQKKHMLLKKVLEKALYTDAPFIQDLIRDLAKKYQIYPTQFFGIQTEMIILPKKLNPAADKFLFLGARTGNQRMITYALNLGANVQAEEEVTPLTDAILHQKLSAVQTLVDRGSNINYYTQPNRWSPLHHAALYINPILEFLVRHPSSDPLKKTADKQTPFSILCERFVQTVNALPGLEKQITEKHNLQGYPEPNTYHYDKASETCYKIPHSVRNIIWHLYLRCGISMASTNYNEYQIANTVITNPPEMVDPLLLACFKEDKIEILKLLKAGTHNPKNIQRAQWVASVRKNFLILYMLGHDIKDTHAVNGIKNELYRVCITGTGGSLTLLKVLNKKTTIKKIELEIALFLINKYKHESLRHIIEYLISESEKQSEAHRTVNA